LIEIGELAGRRETAGILIAERPIGRGSYQLKDGLG
jgi:hypothetical protein